MKKFYGIAASLILSTTSAASFSLGDALSEKLNNGASNNNFLSPKIAPETRPNIIKNLNVRERSDNTISFSWKKSNAAHLSGYRLSRKQSNTDWEVVKDLPLSSNLDCPAGMSTLFLCAADTDLTYDTQYFYRIQAYNQYGVSLPSSTLTAYSVGGEEFQSIMRVQLKLETADISGGGTDEAITVSMGSLMNGTVLNYSHDDFVAGSKFTYDISSKYIPERRDITSITIHKEDTDGLALQSMSLIVNGSEVFNKDFGDTPYWIDDEDPDHSSYLHIDHAELRAHSLWDQYDHTVTLFLFLINGISVAEMTSRIEGTVGSAIHGTDAQWGEFHGDAVEVSPAIDMTGNCPGGVSSCIMQDVDLDLMTDSTIGDLEIDVNFSMVYSCDNNKFRIFTSPPKVSSDSTFLSFLLDLLPWVDIEDGIQSSFNSSWSGSDSSSNISCTLTAGANGGVFVNQEEIDDSSNIVDTVNRAEGIFYEESNASKISVSPSNTTIITSDSVILKHKNDNTSVIAESKEETQEKGETSTKEPVENSKKRR